jgi:hypothetical protein
MAGAGDLLVVQAFLVLWSQHSDVQLHAVVVGLDGQKVLPVMRSEKARMAGKQHLFLIDWWMASASALDSFGFEGHLDLAHDWCMETVVDYLAKKESEGVVVVGGRRQVA